MTKNMTLGVISSIQGGDKHATCDSKCDLKGGDRHDAMLVCMHAGAPSDSADSGSSAVWSALDDALLMFPFTKPVRLALLNLLCSQQVRVPQLRMLSNMSHSVTSHSIVSRLS